MLGRTGWQTMGFSSVISLVAAVVPAYITHSETANF